MRLAPFSIRTKARASVLAFKPDRGHFSPDFVFRNLLASNWLVLKAFLEYPNTKSGLRPWQPRHSLPTEKIGNALSRDSLGGLNLDGISR